MTAEQIVEALCEAERACEQAAPGLDYGFACAHRDAIKEALVECLSDGYAAEGCDCASCRDWRKLEEVCRGKD